MKTEENISPKLPPPTDFKIRKEWENFCWEKLSQTFKALRFLISARDRHNLVLKVYAVQGLQAGKSYREIERETWLSPQTISDLKKAMARNKYQSYSERKKAEPKPMHVPKKLSGRSNYRIQRTKYGSLRIPI